MSDDEIERIKNCVERGDKVYYRDFGGVLIPISSFQDRHKSHQDDIEEPVVWTQAPIANKVGGSVDSCFSLWNSDFSDFMIVQTTPCQ